jgi:SAM-dependent methyltransferase
MQNSLNSEYSGVEELLEIENALPNYNKFIVKKFVEHLPSIDLSEKFVVDFGAGTGTLAEVFRNDYKVVPVCVELAPSLRKTLENRGFPTQSSMSDMQRCIAFIYSSNVLEHIEDDELALRNLFEALEGEGRLAIYVPALMFLFSNLDSKVGHYRRYRRAELIRKVEAAGFVVDQCYYVDSVGVLASLLIKTVGFKNKIGLGSNFSLLIYDRLVFPISKILDLLGFRHVIGKNLLLLASKPKD